jgi:hypothetical protein
MPDFTPQSHGGLDKLAEVGFKLQTAVGVSQAVGAIRLHLGLPGEDKMLCGKARSDLKRPPQVNMRDLCRDCKKKAREQGLAY